MTPVPRICSNAPVPVPSTTSQSLRGELAVVAAGDAEHDAPLGVTERPDDALVPDVVRGAVGPVGRAATSPSLPLRGRRRASGSRSWSSASDRRRARSRAARPSSRSPWFRCAVPVVPATFRAMRPPRVERYVSRSHSSTRGRAAETGIRPARRRARRRRRRRSPGWPRS